MFPELLRDGVWHTTSVERFGRILETGFILPNPQIPDSERWSTACEPHYVRSIGGVSVFDFTKFDEVTYSENYPNSHWRFFVPCFNKWDVAVWIELNPELIKEGFIDGNTLIERWKQQGDYRRIMPRIEAAHIGPVPIAAFRRVLKFNTQTQKFTQLPLPQL